MYRVMINTNSYITVAPAEMAVKPPFANFGHTNARVPVFEANEFFSGWNEFRMIEYPLMPVYTADSAVKTAI